jgi:hypothetical protein
VGIDVEEGGAATTVGTTFTVANDATVAVKVIVGGSFASVDSQLIDADGGAELFAWPTDVAMCGCGGSVQLSMISFPWADSCRRPASSCIYIYIIF